MGRHIGPSVEAISTLFRLNSAPIVIYPTEWLIDQTLPEDLFGKSSRSFVRWRKLGTSANLKLRTKLGSGNDS